MLEHCKELLEQQLVIDEDGDTLDANSQKVKEFWELDEVKLAMMDEEIF